MSRKSVRLALFAAGLVIIRAALAGEPVPAGGKAMSEAEALRIGWPQLSGPRGTFEAGAIDVQLVDDLSKAKKVWESDCADLGRAKGGSQAFRNVEQFTAEAIAKHGSHPGSWAGPIVAEGTVFCASWRPTGEWAQVKGNKVRLDADDFVVAIDALTGKTKWQAIEPGGILRGGGKRQGFQVSPVYHAGVVYSVGSTARLFAHEAATGKKIWESDAHPARAAQKRARESALAGLAQGKFSYDLTPNWCASLAIAQDVLIVPDEAGGLVGVELASGARKWAAPGVSSRWATPSVWAADGREYVLCANEKGDLHLIDPASGKVLWKLSGLGPNWFTLTPGRTHVLVNTVADSGKAKGADRKPGRLGAVRLSTTGGEKAWGVGDGTNHSMPVWMDSGARIRVMYREGRFLVPNCWQSHEGAASGAEDEPAPAAAVPADAKELHTGTALLLEEATGKVLAQEPAAPAWNDQISGLMYWSGDRLLTRADSYHGPSHGGRHPWIHWSLAGDRIARMEGTMDLSAFTNAYEVSMEAPLVAGRIFERTEQGTVVCYDLRAK